ncbi:FAD-dependent oxidoreductase [Pseudaminobacter sp. 19-2017]|uniref:FAD-dependent oxidoreductase n=2 Tax=Pseudaminobacter soli (ex Zhang et al. 2022) TaxID=2831468 RepID=A0A942I2X4_9HYPH|nr:FAD-dependent oxidoreductase [Pseudaminobacter soli]
MEVKNRILSTGHDTVMAHDGHVTERLIAYQEARAKGGAGLIVVQVSGVHETARYTSHVLMATSDDAIPGYRALADAVHRHGAKICGQLFHPGREIMETQDGTAPVAYAPSAVPNSRFHVMPVPMSLRMIREIVSGYGDAAARLMQAGFDGCEIVASHGYLPAQFLNPNVNRRDDEYGGSVENRLRFLREIADDIRSKTSPEFVVGLRITGEEHDSQTLDTGEALTFCQMLDQDGVIDYFNVVAGTSASLKGAVHIVPPMYFPNGYSAPFSAALKQIVTKPVFVAGRINQPQTAEQVLASGQADMCGMTRAMICDPEMPAKAAAGRVDDIRACIACNQACIGHFHKGYPISCIQHPETGRELTLGIKTPAARRKRIIVAGGGPAGMKAAAVLAARGHEVVLHEAAAQLGGQAKLAQLLPGRAEFGGIVTNLAREMELAGVTVKRNSPVTRALVEAEGAEAVVIATGGKPRRPLIEGGEDTHVVDAWQVLAGQANVGANVLIADWKADWIGLGVAEKLARDGCNVTLCVEGLFAGETIHGYVRDTMMANLHRLGVHVVAYARLYGADGSTIYMEHCASGEPIIFEGIETLVVSQGHDRVAELEAELEGFAGEVHVIGDALTPRTAEEAVLDGLKVGRLI